jgi:predicted metalloprotease with PDZ domain
MASIDSDSNENVKVSVMDPEPGQLYVEFMKDGADGTTRSADAFDSGLDVDFKKGHKDRVYISKVEPPASAKLTVGDRLIAMNGKLVESFDGDLGEIRQVLNHNNVIQVVVDPTLQK